MRLPRCRRRLPSSFAAAAALFAAAAVATATAAHAQESLLVLGDSYAFGYSTAAGTPQNIGDNGYVSLFANFLDGQNGAAARPTVLNLARPGETFSTFSTFSSNSGGPNNNGFYNTLYSGSPSPTQASLLGATIAAPPSTIQNVVIQLGGNDVLGLMTQSFWYSPSTTDLQRQAAIAAAVSNVKAGMTTLAQQVRAALPNANLYIMGYGDPFRGIDDSAVIMAGLPGTFTYGQYVKPYTAQGVAASRIAYADVATQVAGMPGTGSVKFIDTYPTFFGNELSLTLIGQEDVNLVRNYHPSAAGYQAIAGQMVAATVPESGTLPLLATGLGAGCLGLVVVRRRRQQQRRPVPIRVRRGR